MCHLRKYSRVSPSDHAFHINSRVDQEVLCSAEASLVAFGDSNIVKYSVGSSSSYSFLNEIFEIARIFFSGGHGCITRQQQTEGGLELLNKVLSLTQKQKRRRGLLNYKFNVLSKKMKKMKVPFQ